MSVSIVAVVDRNWTMGDNGDFPWEKTPKDSGPFEITARKPVIMGRKAYESMMRSLHNLIPGYVFIVLSRQKKFHAPGCLVASSQRQSLNVARRCKREIIVIGGEETYREFLPLAQRLYLAQLDCYFKGKMKFPERVSLAEWKRVSQNFIGSEPLQKHAITFTVFERRSRVYAPPAQKLRQVPC